MADIALQLKQVPLPRLTGAPKAVRAARCRFFGNGNWLDRGRVEAHASFMPGDTNWPYWYGTENQQLNACSCPRFRYFPGLWPRNIVIAPRHVFGGYGSNGLRMIAFSFADVIRDCRELPRAMIAAGLEW